MKTKKLTKITTIALSLLLVLTNIVPSNIYAESKTVDSIGSLNASDDGVTIGSDATQSKKTTYGSDISNDSSNELTEVYVSQASTFGVTIPKVLIIDGKKNESNINTSRYVVQVTGNIGGQEHIDVVPDATCTLKQKAKNDIIATITQDKTSWNWNEFSTQANGLLSTDKLTAGKWSGSFNFNLMIVSPNTPTDSEVITLSQEEVVIGASGTKQIDAFIGGENINDLANWQSDNPSIIVTDGLIETSSKAKAGDFANVTISINLEQIVYNTNNLFEQLLLSKEVYAEDMITTTLRVEIVDINLASNEEEVVIIEAKPNEEFIVKAELSSNPLNIDISWSTTAIGGLNLVRNKNEVKIKVASDMPIGNVYQLIATYGDYSKAIQIKIIDPHTHIYTSAIQKESTCIEKGIKLYSCECGATYTEDILPLGHSLNASPTIDLVATCTIDGSQSIHCSRCSYKEQVIAITKLGHTYGTTTYTWSSDKSTCTASRTCSRCSNVESETKTSTNAITTNATCTTTGTKTYTSDFVNSAFVTQITTSSVAALGHTIVYGGTLEIHEKCSVCGITLNNSHEYTSTIKTPATCTTNGITKYTCACGYTYESENIAALGHTYGTITYTWSSDKTSCTASRTCSRCSNVESETKTSTNAITTNATCTTTGTKTYTSDFVNSAFATQTTTSSIVALGHTYGTITYTWSSDKSTCTASRTCSTCGNIETETKTSTNAITTNATCTTTGTKTYTSDFVNSAFVTQTTTSSVAALGHTVVKGGTLEIHEKCSVCGITLNNSHEYTSTIKTPATCTTKGITKYTCACGYTYENENIAALGHTYGTITYTWSSDKTSCTASRTCSTCGNIETETKTSTNAITTNATCTTTGTKTYTSDFVNIAFATQTTTSSVAALGHTIVYGGTLEIHEKCSVCGITLNNSHEYTSTIKTPATCTTKGITKYTCACGYTYESENIAALGHTYGTITYTWSSDKSTCTASRTCSRCNNVESETKTSTNAITTNATCTTTGTRTYTSDFVNIAFATQTTTSSVSALGHSYIDIIVEPTSSTQGYTNHTCSICGDSYNDNYIDMTYINFTFTGATTDYTKMGIAKTNSVELPETFVYNGINYKTIGISSTAFAGNTSLTSIVLPNSIETIPMLAFKGCTYLNSVTLPNSLKTIEDSAFYGCVRLTSITIPDSVTSIGTYAFYNCTNLKTIKLSNGLENIGEFCFYLSGLTTITIPDSVTTIGVQAFARCSSLISAQISNNVQKLEGTFYWCSKLSSVTIPNSVTSMSSGTFGKCIALSSITIPTSLTILRLENFDGCTGLANMIIPSTVKTVSSYNFTTYYSGLKFTYNSYVCTSLATFKQKFTSVVGNTWTTS